MSAMLAARSLVLDIGAKVGPSMPWPLRFDVSERPGNGRISVYCEARVRHTLTGELWWRPVERWDFDDVEQMRISIGAQLFRSLTQMASHEIGEAIVVDGARVANPHSQSVNYPDRPAFVTNHQHEAEAEPPALAPPVGSRWEHRKGGVYVVFDVAKMKCQNSWVPAVIYASETTGDTWVRALVDFLDGRFRRLS